MEPPPLPPPWWAWHDEGNNPIGDESLGFLKECQKLKELILWGCGITGQGVESLSASGLELETLNLGTD